METLPPTTNGSPGSVCKTAPSCTLLLTPMLMVSLSPRRVAPNHTLLWSASTALPMIEALGATYALIAIVGQTSPNLYNAICPPPFKKAHPGQPPYRSVRISPAATPASIRPCEADSTNGLERQTK